MYSSITGVIATLCVLYSCRGQEAAHFSIFGQMPPLQVYLGFVYQNVTPKCDDPDFCKTPNSSDTYQFGAVDSPYPKLVFSDKCERFTYTVRFTKKPCPPAYYAFNAYSNQTFKQNVEIMADIDVYPPGQCNDTQNVTDVCYTFVSQTYSFRGYFNGTPIRFKFKDTIADSSYIVTIDPIPKPSTGTTSTEPVTTEEITSEFTTVKKPSTTKSISTETTTRIAKTSVKSETPESTTTKMAETTSASAKYSVSTTKGTVAIENLTTLVENSTTSGKELFYLSPLLLFAVGLNQIS